MENKPPKQMTVQLQREDVAKNLVDIVTTMESVRKESIKNFGASDDVKLDYLRLASELASCIEPILKEDKLTEYAGRITELIDNQPLLWFYDPLQPEFWYDLEPALAERLDDLSVVLLRDDFVSESQPYQIFQGLKYLNANPKNREDVSASIQPFNSLLFEELLVYPEVAQYVMQKLFLDYVNKSSDGVGMSIGEAQLISPDYVKRLGQLGALFVDIPHNQLAQMRREFEKTTIIGEGQDRKARVIFSPEINGVSQANMFDFFKGYAQLGLGEVEGNLSSRVTNVHGFGKKFLEAMRKEIGISESSDKARKVRRSHGPSEITKQGDVYVISNIKLYGLDESAHTEYSEIRLDASPVSENGDIASKTQGDWLCHYSGSDKMMLNLPLMYAILEAIHDNKDEEAAKELLQSLQPDFKDSYLVMSTRFNYDQDKVWHNVTTPDQIEFDVHIPGFSDYIESIVNSQEWGNPLRSMFMTRDLEKIPKVLSIYGGNRKGYLYTPSDSRNVERAAFVGFYGVNFDIGGCDDLGNYGRSRGVSAGGAVRAR